MQEHSGENQEESKKGSMNDPDAGNLNEPEIDLIDREGHKEKLETYTSDNPDNSTTGNKEPGNTREKYENIAEKSDVNTNKGAEPGKKHEKGVEEALKEPKKPKEPLLRRILNFYDTQYKKLAIIPVVVFVLAILVIGFQIASTGSFINKDVSLKGGVTLTITKEGLPDISLIEQTLEKRFENNDVSVRALNKGGRQIGVIAVADIDGTDEAELASFIAEVESSIGQDLIEEEYSVEVMGSSLGASFFKETFVALIIAFILMSLVVFAYFRTFVPSLAVVLSALSDIIVTLAIVDLLGMRIGTGGIAAFLMLVGYSVDTDMLLATRLLRRKEGTIFDRTISSLKTGAMMSLTTMGALIAGIIFVESAVIRQIMLIVIIGLAVDNMSTWIQNVAILRYYLERKAGKHKNE